jgi:opacity protein-like surface antigen
VLGISPFVDLDHLFLRRLGAEGEMRFLRWGGPANGAITEDSYLAGPRYDLLHLKDRLRGTARLMFGGAHLAVPKGDAGGGGYFVYAPGGIVEFKVTRRVSARAEYEYQIWPTFSGIKTTSTSGTGGLSPNGFSFGVSYEILPPRSGY